MRLLARGQGLVMRAAAGGLHAHKTHHFVPAHAQQRPLARMPDHCTALITRVDAQGPLPGMIIELHFPLMLEYPLTPPRHPQLTLLLANLTVQLVVAVYPVQARQRYLGNITDGEAEKLFGVLRHTEEECAHYPLASPVSVGSRLGASELAAWRNTREGGYFIPLGALGKGDYQLRLDFSVAGNGKVKLTDDRFEPLVEENLCPQQNTLEFRFKAEGGPHFLTIKAPVVLDSLRLNAVTTP